MSYKTIYKSCIILCIGLLWPLGAYCDDAPAGDTLTIDEIEGYAFLSVPGQAPKPAKLHDVLRKGYGLRAGPKSRATLILNGSPDEKLYLYENSHVSIEAKEREFIFLDEGDVWLEMTRADPVPGKGPLIRTPIGAIEPTRAGSYRIRHQNDATILFTFKGAVEAALIDETGQFKADKREIAKNEKVRISRAEGLKGPEPIFESDLQVINVGPQKAAEPAAPVDQKKTKVTVGASQKAYYVATSCKLDDNIGSCPKRAATPEEEDEQQQQPKDMEYEDYAVFAGDTVDLPVRALLPYPESRFELSHGGDHLVFEGSMMLCVDFDSKNNKLRTKLFQAGKVKPEVAAQKGGSQYTFRSKNKTGITRSQVKVSEGSVAVTTPWICQNCQETKTFLVQTDECYVFFPQSEKKDKKDQEDAAGGEEQKLPPVILQPGQAVDPSGSTHDS